MRIFHPDFYRTIRNINGAVKPPGTRVFEHRNFTFHHVNNRRLKRQHPVKMRHWGLVDFSFPQVQLTRVGEHVYPTVRPRRVVVLLGVTQPADHHSLRVRGIIMCAGAGTVHGLRGVELEPGIQLRERGVHLKPQGLRVKLAHNVP